MEQQIAPGGMLQIRPATPTVKDIFELIEATFFRKLSHKTNWGRNEIRKQWLEAKAEAAIQLLEKSR